jgi:hypothetical protein
MLLAPQQPLLLPLLPLQQQQPQEPAAAPVVAAAGWALLQVAVVLLQHPTHPATAQP